MSTRSSLVTVGLLLLAGLLAVAPAANADRCTCGDLLLPHFEVHLPLPGEARTPAFTTDFAIGSNADHMQQIKMTLYTNWGIPVLTVNYDLEARAVFTANMRQWLVDGALPDRTLSDAELAHLQAALSGQVSPKDGKYYSSPESPETMVGFMLISTALTSGTQNHLFGDIFFLGPTGGDARGESMVRLTANASREVCEQHILRFLQGGQIDAKTSLKIWVPLGGAPQVDSTPNFALRHMSCTIWDEAGVEIGQRSFDLLATQVLQVADFNLPESYGWMTCSFNAAAAVFVSHENSQGYSAALRTFCEETAAPAALPPASLIALQKETNGEDADEAPGPIVDPGGNVVWTYQVSNNGATTLVNIQVTDDQLGPITCPDTSLMSGESMTCTVNGTAPVDLDWPFYYSNLGSVVATVQGSTDQVSDSDASHYYVNPEPPPAEEPAILLQKLINGEDADDPPGPTVTVGDALLWTFEVTNTGNVPLNGVTVADSVIGPITCPKTTLNVGESMICPAASNASEGAVNNIGTASGTSPGGIQVSDTDPANYVGELSPPPGDEGCQQSHWKQKDHLIWWGPTGYSIFTHLHSVFSSIDNSSYNDIRNKTLLEALSFSGGSYHGNEKLLLREAVAALLNAAHPGVDYYYTETEVKSLTNTAIGGSHSDMHDQEMDFQSHNNGRCPLLPH